MAKRFIIFIIVLNSLFVCAGCAYKTYYKNATAAYNSGNYDHAVYMSVNALKAKPDYPEALELLRTAAPLAYERHISRAEDNEKLRNYDAAVGEYKAIEKLASAIASVRSDIIVEGVPNKKASASRNAAEAHYMEGLTLLQEGEARRDNEKLKAAAIKFRKAHEFVPGYKDSRSLYDKARKGAMIRVAILPFQNSGYNDYGRVITDQVIAKAVKQNLEFLEFVTRENLYDIEREKAIGRAGIVEPRTAAEVGKVLGVQYIVVGKVLSATVDNPGRRDTRGSATCKIRENKDRERSGSASWVIYELKATAMINTSFQLIDVRTGQIVSADSVNTKENDIARWMDYGGDEGCLPYEASYLRNGRKTVENNQTLLGKAIEKASTETAGKLVERFK